MKKTNHVPLNPPHPGETLRNKFLIPLGLTQRQLAAAIGVFEGKVSAIIGGRVGLSPAMAWKLAAAFDMSPLYWTNLQAQYDLARTRAEAEGIKPLAHKVG